MTGELDIAGLRAALLARISDMGDMGDMHIPVSNDEWSAQKAEAALRDAEQYAACIMHELAEAKREIAMLQDIVVTYSDRLRMATVHRMDWQQAIDRAFERDPA